MRNEQRVLLACDNPWLASSARALLLEGHPDVLVETCQLAELGTAAANTHAGAIVVLSGSSVLLHQPALSRLRLEQPDVTIILSVPGNKDFYTIHPFTTQVDALIDETQLNRELVPAIQALLTRPL